MRQFNVTGMSCAACSSRVEKAVLKVDGVFACTVNLLTNSMNVDGDADTEEIIKAVECAGYGASIRNKNEHRDEIGNIDCDRTSRATVGDEGDLEILAYKEEQEIRNRIISSIIFLFALMYLSMGVMMWGWPLPSFIENNYIVIGLVQMILATVIIYINRKFYINGFKSLWHRAPNMDTLVALGSSAGYIYSIAKII